MGCSGDAVGMRRDASDGVLHQRDTQPHSPRGTPRHTSGTLRHTLRPPPQLCLDAHVAVGCRQWDLNAASGIWMPMEAHGRRGELLLPVGRHAMLMDADGRW